MNTSKRNGKIPGSNHLFEAFKLCENILDRYQRTQIGLNEVEKNAFGRVQSKMRAMSCTFPRPGTNESAITETLNVSTQSLDPTPIPPSTVQFIETVFDITSPMEEIIKAINHDISAKTGVESRTYYVDADDALLHDPINHAAALLSENTPVSKSAQIMNPYEMGSTMYLPLYVNGALVGCVESPGASLQGTDIASLAPVLRIVAIALRNAILASRMHWETQKAEAMVTMATRLARDTLDETVLVQSIMSTAKELTESDRCSVFLVKEDGILEAHFEDGSTVGMPAEAGIAGYVASTGDIVNIPDAYEDTRFNREVDKSTGYCTQSILCLPIMYEGSIVAVAELINKLDFVTDNGQHLRRKFGERDKELLETFSMFAAASLRNCRINEKLVCEKKKSDAVLDVAMLLSKTDIRDVDSIVRHVLHGAKKLLNADRSSLFLLDKERNELYSRMADSVSGGEIRFPMGQGIAGSVAATGVGENIVDAYSDNRFNRSVDKKLGYHTQSILCEPIVLNGQVLAVVQLVNKLAEGGQVTCFIEEDRKTFKIFSLFAGISINNSHLLEFAVNAGQEAVKLNALRSGMPIPSDKVSLLSITPNERALVLEERVVDNYELSSIDFNIFTLREAAANPLNACAFLAYKLILSTGLLQKFNCREETLLNFILQCRRKYRNVPYHNFFHAVDTCQTMHTYLYAGRSSEFLTELECFVLLITTLVHDLDHMGLNNSFYLKTESPLGILSSASGNTSVLEVHHCNLAVEILSNPECDIFEGLRSDQLNLAYRSMIDCVLATDMSKHAQEVNEFMSLMSGGFDRNDDRHRRKLMEMLMKAADISNVTKPFEISRLWAMAVTEEFYRQGDMEKEKGVEVLPMFDRSLNTELAKGQIGFIDFVSAKFFSMIVSSLCHDMQWCVDRINSNRQAWEALLKTK